MAGSRERGVGRAETRMVRSCAGQMSKSQDLQLLVLQAIELSVARE